jgi:S-DNA-T family DNA segregation ATPase FtsK/SpoIIIE
MLLGVGYFLLPALFVVVGIALFRNTEREVGASKLIGAILFFLSGMGLIHLVLTGHGGLLGGFIAQPLIALFDLYLSILILSAVLVVSLLLIFNAPLALPSLSLPFQNLFARFRREDEDATAYAEIDTYADEEGTEEEEPYEEEEEEEQKSRGVFGFGKRSKEEQPFAQPITGEQYSTPPLSLLEKDRGKPGTGDIKASANIIKRTLQNFGISVEVDEISIGPTVTRYAVKPAEGVRLQKIVGLANNLELALAAHPVRIEAPIPGRSLVGIEVPNTSKALVGLSSLLSSDTFTQSPKALLIALGKDITGLPHYADLGKMPHLLIAGATGSGKSVTIHTLVTSLLYRNAPQMLRFIMIDPKRVELTLYNNIPHLLTPVITDAKKAILALKWAAKEMERRYDILETESVRDIESYHNNIVAPALKKIGKQKAEDSEELPEAMPYIVIIIDELADIMQAYPRELESTIVRLAQMSRAVGIHLVLSTQRPSVNVITGLIKANVPARLALQVSSQIDSRTILDTGGAEKLLGAGDMLYLSGDMGKPKRLQSAHISEKEVKDVSSFLRKHGDDALDELSFSDENANGNGFGDEFEGDDDDELYEEAREMVIQTGKASTSYLQRKFRIGYSRAARLIDILEERGVIGPQEGSRPREVLAQDTAQNDDDEA